MKREIKKRREAEEALASAKRDALISKLDAHIARAVYGAKKSKDEAVKSFAEQHKMTAKEVEALGKEANIL